MHNRPPGPSKMAPEVLAHIDALRTGLLGREVRDEYGETGTVDELIIHEDGDDLSAEVVYRQPSGRALIFRNVHTLTLIEEENR